MEIIVLKQRRLSGKTVSPGVTEVPDTIATDWIRRGWAKSAKTPEDSQNVQAPEDSQNVQTPEDSQNVQTPEDSQKGKVNNASNSDKSYGDKSQTKKAGKK